MEQVTNVSPAKLISLGCENKGECLPVAFQKINLGFD